MIRIRKIKKDYKCILSNPELFSDDELLDYAVKKYNIGDEIIYGDSFNNLSSARPGEKHTVTIKPFFFDIARKGIAGAENECVLYHESLGWQKIIKKKGD